jgi:hypothetical protein
MAALTAEECIPPPPTQNTSVKWSLTTEDLENWMSEYAELRSLATITKDLWRLVPSPEHHAIDYAFDEIKRYLDSIGVRPPNRTNQFKNHVPPRPQNRANWSPNVRKLIVGG